MYHPKFETHQVSFQLLNLE